MDVYEYYALATGSSAPYPIANGTRGVGVGNITVIEPFTGKGCRLGPTRWRRGIMVWAVVVLAGIGL